MKRKVILREVLCKGRSTDYKLSTDTDVQDINSGKNEILKDAPLGETHNTFEREIHKTPLGETHIPSYEKVLSPKLQKTIQAPENTACNDTGLELKINIKRKGNSAGGFTSHPFYKQTMDFLEYFSGYYKKITNTPYCNTENDRNIKLILEKMEMGISLQELKTRCRIFFERDDWWAGKNKFTIGIFASDGVFNTLIDVKQNGPSGKTAPAPRITKENWYEMTGRIKK